MQRKQILLAVGALAIVGIFGGVMRGAASGDPGGCGGEIPEEDLGGSVDPAQIGTTESGIRIVYCGGINAWRCQDGYVCADYPGDECYPENGDQNCSYSCQRQRKN